MIPQS
jgi:hypothetical protein